MTAKELETFLLEEKSKTESMLRCDMCKKYGRCQFCSKADLYPCASAYLKLTEAREAGVKISSMYFPEPAVPEELNAEIAYAAAPAEKSAAAPVQTAHPADEDQARLATVSEILSDYKMNELSGEREQEYRKISAMMDSPSDLLSIVRIRRKETDVALLKIAKKQ